MVSRDRSPEVDGGASSCWAAHPEVSAHTWFIGAKGDEQQLFLLPFPFHAQPHTLVSGLHGSDLRLVCCFFFPTFWRLSHFSSYCEVTWSESFCSWGFCTKRNVVPQATCRLISPSPAGKARPINSAAGLTAVLRGPPKHFSVLGENFRSSM